jgi:peptidoglycan/LPS O-acetylase OafA/YrhL
VSRSSGPGRIAFANQLRGLAAFAVLFSHYFGAFWGKPEDVGKILGIPAAVIADPPQRLIVFGSFDYFNFGPFGVALFFLISGFVIPISLERLGALPCLVARVLRIWPTYIAGFGLSVLVLAGWHWFHGTPFPYPWTRVFIQAAIVLREWLWVGVIDGIVWTLEIEVKFYVLMAVLFWLTGTIRLRYLMILAVGFAVVGAGFGINYDVLLNTHVWWFKRLAIASINFTFFPYMFIGTGFYLLYRGRIRPGQLAGAVLLFGACSALAWIVGFLGRGEVVASMASYVVALALFVVSYYYRDRFTPHFVPDFLADISYPLYIIHSFPGYLLMYALVQYDWPPYATMAVATVMALAMAYGLHRLVERPTQQAGRRLAARKRGEIAAQKG